MVDHQITFSWMAPKPKPRVQINNFWRSLTSEKKKVNVLSRTRLSSLFLVKMLEKCLEEKKKSSLLWVKKKQKNKSLYFHQRIEKKYVMILLAGTWRHSQLLLCTRRNFFIYSLTHNSFCCGIFVCVYKSYLGIKYTYIFHFQYVEMTIQCWNSFVDELLMQYQYTISLL